MGDSEGTRFHVQGVDAMPEAPKRISELIAHAPFRRHAAVGEYIWQ
jgi:hypothetical protein